MNFTDLRRRICSSFSSHAAAVADASEGKEEIYRSQDSGNRPDERYAAHQLGVALVSAASLGSPTIGGASGGGGVIGGRKMHEWQGQGGGAEMGMQPIGSEGGALVTK